jgi:hypothetical protein
MRDQDLAISKLGHMGEVVRMDTDGSRRQVVAQPREARDVPVAERADEP